MDSKYQEPMGDVIKLEPSEPQTNQNAGPALEVDTLLTSCRDADASETPKAEQLKGFSEPIPSNGMPQQPSELSAASGEKEGEKVPEIVDLFHTKVLKKRETETDVQIQKQPNIISLKLIGETSKAFVYRYREKGSFNNFKALFLVKFDLSQADSVLKMKEEAEKYKELGQHPNLVKFYGEKDLDLDGRMYRFLVEYMELGSCRYYKQCEQNKDEFSNGFPEDHISVILREALKGLKHLHEKGRIHREINAGHIYVTAEGEIRLGVAASVYEHLCHHRAVTDMSEINICSWAAPPEVWNSEEGEDKHSEKSDIWQIGITALELAYGGEITVAERVELEAIVCRILAEKSCPMKFAARLEKKERRTRRFSKEFDNMVMQCLAWLPEERPTVEDLLKCKFLRKSVEVEFLKYEKEETNLKKLLKATIYSEKFQKLVR